MARKYKTYRKEVLKLTVVHLSCSVLKGSKYNGEKTQEIVAIDCKEQRRH
jgi:hypothetical protein